MLTNIPNRARASYGVVCRQIYDPIRHPGAVVQPDFYNKNQKWAIDQIEWLIRKVWKTIATLIETYADCSRATP